MHPFLRSSPFLLLLAPALRAQAPLYDLGGLNGDTLGTAIAPIDDLDGDGVDDLILGGEFGDGLQPDAGRVLVLSGKTGATLLALLGQKTGDRFGHSVSSCADLSGDGKDDILVGAPGFDDPFTGTSNAGRFTIFSGASGAALGGLTGWTAGDQFGWVVRRVGDLDGDQVDDFAIGSPYVDDAGIVNRGHVIALSGAGFSFLFQSFGPNAGDLYGYSLDGAGDSNGDGFGDVLIGAPGHGGGASADGAAYLRSGAPGGSNLHTFLGSLGGELGFSVAGLQDVDGDGVMDFALGRPGFSVFGTNAGQVRVFSGASKSWLRDFNGAVGDRLGFTLASAGDFDSDGRGDLIAGAPFHDFPGLIDAGQALVYSAHTGALLSAFGGSETLGQMGLAVASLGDLNGDGADEAAAGAPFEDWGHVDAGHVRVHLGASPAPQAYCTAKVNSAGCTPFITYAGAASWTLGAGLTVIGANLLPGLPGLMIWSKTPNAAPFFGGTLCVGAPLFRTSGQVAGNNPLYTCTGQYSFQVDVGFLGANGLLPSMDLYAQFWSRDLGFAAPNNVGLTNGLHVVVLH
jgi:hypothetical protein